MAALKHLPIVLTIAGSDSGGGAGIQADLHTFAALGTHGVTALTCLTAQNPRGVLGVQPVTPSFLRQQLEAIVAELPPAAAKTGMLYARPLIEATAEFFASLPQRPPLVVDPVMVATSGARLLQPTAIRALQNQLLPLAALVTPNVDEAEILTGLRLRTPEDLRAAARAILERFGCAALIKGGHLRGLPVAVDVYNDGRTELLLEAPRVPGVTTHGTGCTYSAAVAAALAQGLQLPAAVGAAKEFITAAIAGTRRAGRHQVLGWASASHGRRKAGLYKCGCSSCHCA